MINNNFTRSLCVLFLKIQKMASYYRKWKSGDGPIKDAYNIGENPQYSLEIQSGDKDPTVWLLLTRHITDRVCNIYNISFVQLNVHCYVISLKLF